MFANKLKNILFSEGNLPPQSPEITDEIRRNFDLSRSPAPKHFGCYAPFKNMYFGYRGNVLACCYNRLHKLGTYPAQTIHQIWNSAETNDLRNHLKAYNYSMGCEVCRFQLVAGNFEGTKAKLYDAAKLGANGYPGIMEFELSNICNLECVMCNGDHSSLIRKKREHQPELISPYDDAFVSQLEDFIPYLSETRFYGGEPFLIDIYYAIWDLIIRINPSISISVQTNGTTLNNRVKELLQNANFNISVSIDSLKKDVYESIRVNGNFERVMENIQYFHQYAIQKGVFFGLSVCIMKQNWSEAPDFIRYCNALNAPVYFHTVFQPGYLSLKQLPQKQLQQIFTELNAQLPLLPEQTLIEQQNKKHYHDFILQILEWGRLKEVDDLKEKFDSADQFIAYLVKKTFDRKDITEERKAVSSSHIRQKITALAAGLPQDINVYDHFRNINASDDRQLIEYLDSLEKADMDQALTHLIWNKEQ